jgi:hypothetical protein
MLREFRVFLLFALMLMVLTPASVFAQRYGRPYSLAEDPQLLLQIKVQNKSRYFRPADLRKMQASVVTESDPATKATHVYEGVALEQLVPAGNLATPGERIEIGFGSHQSVSISQADLDTQVKPMVVYTVDGKQLSGHAPYDVVLKARGKPVETIANVACITVKQS